MPPRDADLIRQTIEECLVSAEPFASTIVQNPRATIRPEARRATGATARAAAVLDGIRARSPNGGPDAGIEYERTLGEGGMGVVRLATQTSLGRKVAVKTLRADMQDPGAVEKLLREAWITGALEHPNVVPVHAVGVGADGLPYIVLKRIEGVHWGDAMRDERAVRDRYGARDLLDWNLRILLQVCDAVHFAHSRGILHRDLKPENVMVGEFGEVYVLDWGIAVSLVDDGSGRFPLAADASEIAGTPCYMAPEMLGNRAAQLGPGTDVYLLGATLYEIACGRPPHAGDGLMDVLRCVVVSQPELPDEVPAEIARIVRRAMDPDLDARFESVKQLRLAVQGFLQHRDSAQLVSEAERRLGELSLALAASPADPSTHRVRLYHLFGECRFGFRQALRTWPENEAASRGLRRAIEAMVDFELAQGSPESAAGLLAEVADPPAELVARVEAVRRAAEAERRRAEALRVQMDPTIGWRTRTFATAVLGVLWTTGPFVAKRVEVIVGGASHQGTIVAAGILLVFASALFTWGRESMMKTRLNRGLVAATLFVLAAQMVLAVGGAILGVDPVAVQVLHLFLWFCVNVMMSFTLERRLAPAALGQLVGFLLAARWPARRFEIMSATNFLLALNLVIAWPSDGPRRDWRTLFRAGDR